MSARAYVEFRYLRFAEDQSGNGCEAP